MSSLDYKIIDYIKSAWDCISYANSVLGLPVYKNGDRCVSPLRPDASNPTSFVVYNDYFVDFGGDIRGDVIDLCAHAHYNGDISQALHELAGNYFPNIGQEWKKYTAELEEKINYWHSQLRPEDVEYLHSRRINDNTIKRLRIGYSTKRQRLTIPYFKNGHVVYWIGRDRTGDPSRAKYFKEKIDEYNEHIPWGLHTLAKDFGSFLGRDYSEDSQGRRVSLKNTLCILEGMFDAMSFEQEGFHVLSPISGYFNKQQYPAVITAAKKHDLVFVCFDSDKAGTRFTLDMCKKFFQNRIKFVTGALPQGIKDVSDYYAAGGNLADLITNSENGLITLARKFEKKEEFAEFLRGAARYVYKTDLHEIISCAVQFPKDWRQLLLEDCTKTPRESLIVEDIQKSYELSYHVNEGFFEYKHGVWKLIPDEFVKRIVDENLGLFSTSAKQNSVATFLRSRLSTQERFNQLNMFNFVNGILDLETCKLLQHDKKYMSSIQVNYPYDENAKCTLFLRFLDDVMLGDADKIKLLQQMAGYVFFPDCRHEKSFMLIGDGANGKSVLINTLRAVFGEENCSNITISALASPFEPIRLLHSIANFSTEMKSDVKGTSDIFKQCVSGEQITAAYKGKDSIPFCPRAKWIFSANNFISSNDITHGYARRIVFVKFMRTFQPQEMDLNLTAKLRAEIPGIFNWALQGYKELIAQGKFSITPESKELTEEFLRGINPMVSFAEEKLLSIAYEPHYDTKTMYGDYVNWCKENGNSPKNRINFTRTIKQILAQKRPDVQYIRGGGDTYFKFNAAELANEF